MTALAIRVQNIAKSYRLNHQGQAASTFREALTSLALDPIHRFRRLRGTDEATTEEFWALRDITFDIHEGEVVGIVGRNGAGKSTLLKVLSRIVQPTLGRAELHGRVASLLEVGTGFHPELSGRENIYMNGSILGMKRREIQANFDRIVEFAEVERFLDTPVKRYSSGMYVRLAFAVAAHLEPEILIVDEVLAVGDAEFQKRCLGKLKEISTGKGRTVLFVSHNMAAVRAFCTHGILLDRGKIEIEGTVDQVIGAYAAQARTDNAVTLQFKKPKGAAIWIERAALLVDGVAAVVTPMGASLRLSITFRTESPIRQPKFGYVLVTDAGDLILNSNNRFQPSAEYETPTSSGTIECDLGEPPLMPGRYAFSLWLGDRGLDHHVELEALWFEVIERDLWGLGQLPPRGTFFWWPTKYRFL